MYMNIMQIKTNKIKRWAKSIAIMVTATCVTWKIKKKAWHIDCNYVICTVSILADPAVTTWPPHLIYILCTRYVRKVYRSLQVWVPHTILKYLSIQKLTQKWSYQSIYLSNLPKKIILCYNFITNINIC